MPEDADSRELPEGLDHARDAELRGREHHPWLRRALLAVLTAVTVGALANVFGQSSSSTTAAVPAATFTVRTPSHVRGGLLFQTRFTVLARRRIEDPKLVLSPGWFDGFTLNTSKPDAGQESSRDGNVVLAYDSIEPGERLVVWLEWQVNPTNVERRRVHAELYDGGTRLAGVDRTVTVFP